jgi:hypothetical protein
LKLVCIGIGLIWAIGRKAGVVGWLTECLEGEVQSCSLLAFSLSLSRSSHRKRD